MSVHQEFALLGMVLVGAPTAMALYFNDNIKSAWAVGIIFCGPAVAHVWLKGVLG